MADSTLGTLRKELTDSPAADRLKDELRNYLMARATHTVTNLGDRLGEGAGKLAGSAGDAGGLAGSLAKGGQALTEGKSPLDAAKAIGKDQLKNTLKDKVKGVFGQGRKGGGGKSKSVTISEDIDVGVPVRTAYDQWTQFQEFSTFAKGVVSVEKGDDTSSNWRVKVAKSTRSWKANVTEQVPDQRITWTTEGAKGTVKGVVTFHAITDDLTRVLMVLEYFPKGFFEKTGNIWRAQGRRARLDLKLYRKFIMMRGEATDAWRGEIRDGEVVMDHDEAMEREQEEQEGQDGEEPEVSEGSEESEEAEEEGAQDDDEDGDRFEDEEAEDEEAEAEDGEDEPYDDELDEPEAGQEDADAEPEDDEEAEGDEEAAAEDDADREPEDAEPEEDDDRDGARRPARAGRS
ncbi:SRPBCC family protein [Streptomyces montanisoli]|uniref:SRPBCC family protein n=1 Tax=Streptomyces montanisoli TaxID=2798581 RepID=A0A940S107_9ACTN|nr:SRPBCC family protein [Streptomyces montanisoli]MBP0461858.1 SRPBCC family protein [Streptomyces montanisoli]